MAGTMGSVAGLTLITPRLSAEQRDRATVRLRQEQARAQRLAAQKRWQPKQGMTLQARAALRGRALAHRDQLRAQGKLLDTWDTLMTHAVRLELADRAWDVDWPPLPPDAPHASRWPGSRERGWQAKINARIPVSSYEQVQGGCYWTSAEAINAIRAWRDDHPDVVTEMDHPEAWARYEELALQVTTPGMVWRAAIDRVAGT
ncbi:hypothetical protein [Nonomuraea sp. NPDC059022]|uniref:hypothetical protein n=1 Tax=Nonomuraea sp. NPDC059022 TaxID=3346705 RepID=UPI0036CF0A06